MGIQDSYFPNNKKVFKMFFVELIENCVKLFQNPDSEYRKIIFGKNLNENTYRNDFAFAIALHILNGHMKSDWPIQLPIKLFYITDRDKIVSYKDNTWQFKLQGDLDCKIKDINIHVMNKIGLMKVIKDE